MTTDEKIKICYEFMHERLAENGPLDVLPNAIFKLPSESVIDDFKIVFKEELQRLELDTTLSYEK